MSAARGALLGAAVGFALAAALGAAEPGLVVMSTAALAASCARRGRRSIEPTDVLVVRLLLAATLGAFVLGNAGLLGVWLGGAVGTVAVLLAAGALLARSRNGRRRASRRGV